MKQCVVSNFENNNPQKPDRRFTPTRQRRRVISAGRHNSHVHNKSAIPIQHTTLNDKRKQYVGQRDGSRQEQFATNITDVQQF